MSGSVAYCGERSCRRTVPSGARRFLICSVAVAWIALVAQPASSATARPFLWGVATSAYQTEGNLTNDDYDFFNSDPAIHAAVAQFTGLGGPPINTMPAGEATRSWQPAYYRRDFDNARLLGLNSFRISIEWSRIEPAQGVWNLKELEKYVKMIEAMTARHLRPIVTLNHFTLPLWVLRPPVLRSCLSPLGICQPLASDPGFASSLRGWENPRVVAEYLKFVRVVVSRLASRVDYWLTINEPVGSMIDVGYIAGVWSPGFLADGARAKLVLHNLIEAHVQAYNLIHLLDHADADGDKQAASVGFAHAMIVTTPSSPDGKNVAASSNFGYFANDYFLNAVVDGEEDLNYVNGFPCCTQHDTSSPNFVLHPEWRNKVDFIGLNYYRRAYVYQSVLLVSSGYIGGAFDNNLYGHFEVPHGLLNDLGWEVYPQGLYDVLMKIKRQWNKPVLITENGMPESADRNRPAYIVSHLRAVQRAMQDGANVFGYLYWALNDNWELAENYRAQSQFGLFHVDRDPADPRRCLGNCHRAITESALAYRLIVAESTLGDALRRPTTLALDTVQREFGAFNADGRSVIPPQRTYLRAYAGHTSTGRSFELLVMRAVTKPVWLPLIYWNDLTAWHTLSAVGPTTFRESWFDDANLPQSRDHSIAASTGGALAGKYASGATTVTWTATPIPAVGLWQWAGPSPWGGTGAGRWFSISNLEGAYRGKFFTYPTATHAATWRQVGRVSVGGATVELDAQPMFDLTLELRDPSHAVTVARRSGSWTADKAFLPLQIGLGQSGDAIAAGEIFWTGARSDGGGLEFTEGSPNFLSFPAANTSDQLRKENDETTVSFRTFAFQPAFPFGGQVTVDAGGRNYICQLSGLSSCVGTWRDDAGAQATRLNDVMPAFP